MRGAAFPALLLLAACGGADETRPWSPGEAVTLPEPAVVSEDPPPPDTAPQPLVRPLPPPPLPLQRPSRPYYEPPDHEPSVQSRGSLTDSEERALRGVRQSLDSSISELERRARFGDTTAAEERELRTLKARQRDVLRRLRGG